jgi:hypothetical protein
LCQFTKWHIKVSKATEMWYYNNRSNEPHMNYETLEEIVCGRISDLVDQMLVHQTNGNEVMLGVLHREIQDLKAAMNSDDASDNFFYATDYRYLDQA